MLKLNDYFKFRRLHAASRVSTLLNSDDDFFTIEQFIEGYDVDDTYIVNVEYYAQEHGFQSVRVSYPHLSHQVI